MKHGDIQSGIIKKLKFYYQKKIKVIPLKTPTKGWPDLQIMVGGVTLFLEIKTANDDLSDDQKRVMMWLMDNDFFVRVASSVEEGMSYLTPTIESILGWEKNSVNVGGDVVKH